MKFVLSLSPSSCQAWSINGNPTRDTLRDAEETRAFTQVIKWLVCHKSFSIVSLRTKQGAREKRRWQHLFHRERNRITNASTAVLYSLPLDVMSFHLLWFYWDSKKDRLRIIWREDWQLDWDHRTWVSRVQLRQTKQVKCTKCMHKEFVRFSLTYKQWTVNSRTFKMTKFQATTWKATPIFRQQTILKIEEALLVMLLFLSLWIWHKIDDAQRFISFSIWRLKSAKEYICMIQPFESREEMHESL